MTTSTKHDKKRASSGLCNRWLILSIVLTVIVAFAGKTLYDAGEFSKIRATHLASQCRRTELGANRTPLSGLEDADIIGDWILFSSDPRLEWMKLAGNSDPRIIIARPDISQGHIFGVQVSNSLSAAVPFTLKGFPHPDFHPHGIGIWSDNENSVLFVVNHRRDGDAVEVFDIDLEKRELHYQSSVVDAEKLRNLNDVAPTSASSFVATNWLFYSPGEPMHSVEMFSQARWSFVSSCSRDIAWNCHKSADHFAMANGVSASPSTVPSSERYVYVASSIGRDVSVFRQVDGSDKLEPVCSAFLGFGADNMQVLDNGDVLLAGHPQLFQFLFHQKDVSHAAPSRVVRLSNFRPMTDSSSVAYVAPGVVSAKTLPACSFNMSTIFESLGQNNWHDIPAASIGLIHPKLSKQLVIGSVFVDGYLLCPLV